MFKEENFVLNNFKKYFKKKYYIFLIYNILLLFWVSFKKKLLENEQHVHLSMPFNGRQHTHLKS